MPSPPLPPLPSPLKKGIWAHWQRPPGQRKLAGRNGGRLKNGSAALKRGGSKGGVERRPKIGGSRGPAPQTLQLDAPHVHGGLPGGEVERGGRDGGEERPISLTSDFAELKRKSLNYSKSHLNSPVNSFCHATSVFFFDLQIWTVAPEIGDLPLRCLKRTLFSALRPAGPEKAEG